MKKINGIVEILFYIVVGGVCGFFIRSVTYTDNTSSMQIIKGNTNYPYISQRLDSESLSETTQGQIVTIKSSINQYISEIKDQGKATQVAVYYRDINNGPWMGINEKDEFSPASLLKVPIMIGVYKIADADRSLLSKTILNQVVNDGVIPDFEPSKQVKQGDSYTIDDLVRRMIVYSDNDAKNLLLSQIQESQLNQIYKDLGMVVPGIVSLEDNMSVRSYASFFRILYNGSYLSRELSNRALELLSQSEFTKGLVAGVPKNIKVSHKFGERGFIDGVKQLHDCGVIYMPENPYVLCIMTRGTSWDKLTEVVAHISKIVYSELNEK